MERREPRASDQARDPSQTRGTREAYERYLSGMDASMRQKVALTAAHLLCTGKIADMGMGSGAGSHALAALYPMLSVVGVDLDGTMVAMAKERYRLPNLDFVQGDIATRVFEAETLDGIFDSSVLHHVTSFGGYDYERAARCLENQIHALKAHGVLVVRDFLAPGPGEVVLEVSSTDGDDGIDPNACSTAKLFERFGTEFRLLHEHPGFPVVEEAPAAKGSRRFRTSMRLATEFVLRKDYRTDWVSEVKEEYTYFTQPEFEQLFARLGLRVLASTPIRNPWIVRHRFKGKFSIADREERPIDWPATNYVIAGEKVRDGEGVRFSEAGASSPLGFLQMDHYRDVRDGKVLDLVRRPHTSIDVVPYFELDDDLFVLARMSYPRPILSSTSRSRAVDESTAPHYVTEPLNVLQTDKPLGQTVEEMLATHAKIGGDRIRAFRPAVSYYPSPGGSQEEVRSVLVEVEPVFVEENVSNVSGFSTSGRIRAIEAEQVLRAAQVGGLPDARLELNVYELFIRRGRAPGPWIGESIELGTSDGVRAATDIGSLARRPSRRVFERATADASRRFLELRASRFAELDARGTSIAEATLEYVVPRGLSTNTVACALLARVGDAICIGVDDDDLPAAQCFLGNSELLVAPAWRLPREVTSTGRARVW
ncbi:MAG TPA: methyltransferase domain-containing protein, partial [Labilithrix sp.]|nr:methyltransferase domain-containing protein [Labilithrix sp.]